jgi:pectate lyase
MQNKYWIKDQTRQEIITKTPISNNGNFNLFANYYNLMDGKGIGFQIGSDLEIEVEKLYRKNGFEYLVLEHNNQKELYILPNERIEEYSERIASKVEFCKSDEEVLHLLIDEMN